MFKGIGLKFHLGACSGLKHGCIPSPNQLPAVPKHNMTHIIDLDWIPCINNDSLRQVRATIVTKGEFRDYWNELCATNSHPHLFKMDKSAIKNQFSMK